MQIDERLQRLTDAFLDQMIDREAYNQRRTSLLNERVTAGERLKKIADPEASARNELEDFFELVFSLQLSFRRAFPHEKRELVALISSNLSFDGKNLVVELRKPFAQIVECRKQLYGGPFSDEVRTERLRQIVRDLYERWDKDSVATDWSNPVGRR